MFSETTVRSVSSHNARRFLTSSYLIVRRTSGFAYKERNIVVHPAWMTNLVETDPSRSLEGSGNQADGSDISRVDKASLAKIRILNFTSEIAAFVSGTTEGVFEIGRDSAFDWCKFR